MKLLLGIVLLVCLLCGFLFYQGSRSARQPLLALAGGSIPICGSKPNCVCSLQDPADEHYIEAIEFGSHDASAITAAIESIGGKVVSNDGVVIQATVTSGLFRFVDDLVLQIDGATLNVRSSSRVGHSDLGANRKRIESLRQALS